MYVEMFLFLWYYSVFMVPIPIAGKKEVSNDWLTSLNWNPGTPFSDDKTLNFWIPKTLLSLKPWNISEYLLFLGGGTSLNIWIPLVHTLPAYCLTRSRQFMMFAGFQAELDLVCCLLLLGSLRLLPPRTVHDAPCPKLAWLLMSRTPVPKI